MKGDPKVIEYLNKGLRSELTAINQYWIHYRLLDDWGYLDLAKKWRAESIEEMQHADLLIKRILFLEGLPNLQELEKLLIGETVKEILENDLKLEIAGAKHYREAVEYADSVRDYVSRDLFSKILADEEHHIDYLETQLELFKQIGEQNYIQLNSESPLDSEG